MNPYLKNILTSPNKYDIQFALSNLKFSFLKSEATLDAFQEEEEQLTANLHSTNRHRRIAYTSIWARKKGYTIMVFVYFAYFT